MNCNHHWIGDTCTNCGIAYHIWTEQELTRLRSELDAAKAREAKLRKALKAADTALNHSDNYYFWRKYYEAKAAIDAAEKELKP